MAVFALGFAGSASAANAQMAMPSAAAAPTAGPPPTRREAAFLAAMMRELPRRYGTPAAAVRAGYVRYTNEDETGAISYVDTRYWNSPDVAHPAQVWYDVRGRLIGADYSELQANAPRGTPSILGLSPSRAFTIRAHVHYVTCTPGSASCTYGRAIGAKAYAAANGGDFRHPTAQGLVKAGAVTDAALVRTVFLYPAIYDVAIWVVPNPLGQFADRNPNVTPSPHAGRGDEM